MVTSNNKVPVSVLVPVKNEAHNLPRCLASVCWADEIIVVDSHSTDGTPEVATKLGAQVVQFDFKPPWPKKKNWALENLPFKHEWVFLLDADEVMPPGAEAEFRATIALASVANCAGYWINRRFMFMGKWLRHAYYPNWNLRLFKHRVGRFEKITGADTASGDNEVHEHVIVQGSTDRLKCEMDHYAFPSVEVFVEKHNRYSNWEARVALEEAAADPALQNPEVASHRRLKRLVRKLPFRPLLRFLHVYLWQGGIWDGREGYYFARMHALYELLSVAKTYEYKKWQVQGRTGSGTSSGK